MIAGIAPGPIAFVSKITTSGTSLWSVSPVVGGTPQIICIIMLTDGSFIIADSHDISSKQNPFIASVSNAGAINWENYIYSLCYEYLYQRLLQQWMITQSH